MRGFTVDSPAGDRQRFSQVVQVDFHRNSFCAEMHKFFSVFNDYIANDEEEQANYNKIELAVIT